MPGRRFLDAALLVPRERCRIENVPAGADGSDYRLAKLNLKYFP